MAIINDYAQSFAVPNYSGILYAKGNVKTPFLTLIGAAPERTDHVEFTCGQYYEPEAGEQPEISETASLTAPDPVSVTREQMTNVTQIFQATIGVSYAKQSNMGTMSGINAANQTPTPANELDFQIAKRMEKIGQDVEYTLINGVYQKATADGVANKTRGILEAIETNVIDMEGASLTYWKVAEGLALIREQGGLTDQIVLGVSPTAMLQLNYDAAKNNMTIAPLSREVNGYQINTVVTALGVVGLVILDTLPKDTAILFNPFIIHPVNQYVPDKGNFFVEPLARAGAGDRYQIFGQVGLDHGPEWMAAKFTNISTDTPSGE